MHYLKDPRLWELQYIPYDGAMHRIYINSHMNASEALDPKQKSLGLGPRR